MLDLIQPAHISLFFPLLVFVVSVMGSWHCAAMCSPLACFLEIRGQKAAYHLARGFSYAAMGGIFGVVGEFSISHSGRLLGLVLIGLALTLLYLKGSRSQFFLNIARRSHFSAWIIGLMTPLMPCAWLWSFFVLASQSGSWMMGSTVMTFFFLGTLPAMVLIPRVFKDLYAKNPASRQLWVRRALWLGSLLFLSGHLFLNH